MVYRAIIFDLDGTLFDSITDLANSANYAISKHVNVEHPVESYIRWIGDGAYKLIERALIGKVEDKAVVQECLDDFLNHYSRNWNIKSRLYEGVPEVLDFLNKNNVAISILSNKPHLITQAVAKEYFDKWNWFKVLGQRDGVPKKPDPSAVMEIVRASGIPVDQYLYIGDSNTDMKTAQAADMDCIGVTWGFGKIDASLATHVVENMTEFMEAIKKAICV